MTSTTNRARRFVPALLLTAAATMTSTTIARAGDPVSRARALLEDVRAGRAAPAAFLSALDAARALDGAAADRLLVDAAFSVRALPIEGLVSRLDAAALGDARPEVERALVDVHRLWWRALPARGWRRDTADEARALAERIRRDVDDTAGAVARLDERAPWWGAALTPYLDERLAALGELEVVGGDLRLPLAGVGATSVAGRVLARTLRDALGGLRPAGPARGLAGALQAGDEPKAAAGEPRIEVLELPAAPRAGGRVRFVLRLASPDDVPLRSYVVKLEGPGDLNLETARLPEERELELAVDLPTPAKAGPAALEVEVRLADGRQRSLALALQVVDPAHPTGRLP